MAGPTLALPKPTLAGLLGTVLLGAFWASCLFGPAALVGLGAGGLGMAPGTSALLAVSSVAATLLTLRRVVGNPSTWRGM